MELTEKQKVRRRRRIMVELAAISTFVRGYAYVTEKFDPWENLNEGLEKFRADKHARIAKLEARGRELYDEYESLLD